jgi:hypothetical protein
MRVQGVTHEYLSSERIKRAFFDQIFDRRGLLVIGIDLDERIGPVTILVVLIVNFLADVIGMNGRKTARKAREILQNRPMAGKNIITHAFMIAHPAAACQALRACGAKEMVCSARETRAVACQGGRRENFIQNIAKHDQKYHNRSSALALWEGGREKSIYHYGGKKHE